MPTLEDINAYAKYPKEKMHTIRVHLFFAFIIFFILIGLRSVLFLNIEAVYKDMGKNSFYVQLSGDEQEEKMDDIMHNLYDDVEKSTFTEQSVGISGGAKTRIDEIMHSNDISNFYFREYYCYIDIYEEKLDGVMIYEDLAKELFGYSDERVLSQKIKLNIFDRSSNTFEKEYDICGIYRLKEVDTIFTTNKYNAAKTIFHYVSNDDQYNGTKYLKYTSSHINSMGEIDKINRLLAINELPPTYDSYIYNSSMHLKTCEMINMIIDFSFTFTVLVIVIKIIILYFLKYDQDIKIFKIRSYMGESSPHLFLFLFLSQLRTFIPIMLIGFGISILFKIIIEATTFLFFPSYLTYLIYFAIAFLISTLIAMIISAIRALTLNKK